MSNINQFPIPAIPISQVSPVSAANLTDIFTVVQSGITGLETLQQVLNLFLPNLFLDYAGNPNGNVAGTKDQVCYDTTHNILYVCTVTGTTTSAVWRTSVPIISTNVITANASLSSNTRYVCNGVSTLTLTLPTTSSVGDVIKINGYTGGWHINQGSSQQILVSPNASTVGTGGSVSSSHVTDSLELVCLVANTIWSANSWTGTGLTIV